jgi:hypothetical protein
MLSTAHAPVIKICSEAAELSGHVQVQLRPLCCIHVQEAHRPLQCKQYQARPGAAQAQCVITSRLRKDLGARMYRPSFRENKPKNLVFSH